ncbi:formate/nitrite transporter family protein [Gallaecimonas mangrovi]|uniref:formate/nitrite transporter family protein n=1 Tax=Gallaecimonas mangrovi TaxID=2291597 RepID=UPI000E205C64|nr:formate/nitrite transporter family protein [Gallaecimonas mangrovi]
MSIQTPKEITNAVIQSGVRKSGLSMSALMILGFMAGAFIALGFLLDIRVTATLPHDWSSFGLFLGAAVFPVGLILTVLAGGELLTGNMMYMATALFSGKIGVAALVRNWVVITIANFIGAVFIAYFFGHYLGLGEGAFLAKSVAVAKAKLKADFMHAFVSGIGCNWLVCLGIWLGLCSKEAIGKILGLWFPVMAFVAIGFQHVVANMFIIPLAIFAGAATWGEYFGNFVPVFLGNVVGGALFVGIAYYVALVRESGNAPEAAAETQTNNA